MLSGLLELTSIASGEEGEQVGTAELIVATVLAFITGYLSIAFLLRWLTSHSMTIFVVYRVALGALVLVLVGSGAIE